MHLGINGVGKRSGNIKDWSKLVIKQANNEKIFCKQLSGNSLWKNSESGEIINQINEKEIEKPDSTFSCEYIRKS